MRIGWLLSRDALRHRVGSLAGLALTIALVTAVVLAGAAGARRTAGALDRFREATHARDMAAIVLSPDLVTDIGLTEDLRDGVASVEGVSAVTRAFAYFVNPEVEGANVDLDFVLTSSPDGYYETIDRPLVVAGRMPARDSTTEVALNESAADSLGLEMGDTLVVATFQPETIAGLFEGAGFPEGPDGPTLELDVVGTVRTGEELSATSQIANPTGITSAAFANTYEGKVGRSVTLLGITSEPDADLGAVQQVLDEQVGTEWEAVAVRVEDDYVGEVTRAHQTLAVGIAVFALVAAIAGLLAIGQALSRQNLLRSNVDHVARGLGATRRERILAVCLPTWFAIGTGVVVGVIAAIALSPLFPLSIARRAETSTGMRIDPLVLGAGAVAITAVCIGWSLLSARRIVSRSAATVPVRAPSPRLASTLARWGLRPSTMVGLRAVADPGRGPTAVPARSAVLGAAVAVTGVVAIATFALSVQEAQADPARYGWAWSSSPEVLSQDPTPTADAMAEDPDLTATGVLHGAPVEVGPETAYAYALDVRAGSMDFTLLEGDLPTSPREVALGARTLGELDLTIGDAVPLAAPNGDPQDHTIVGVVVPPLVDSSDPGKGAVLTLDGLESIRAETPSEYLVLTYRAGVDREALEARLAEEYELAFTSSSADAPGQLQQLDAMRSVFVALTAFLAGIGVLGLLHFLAVSVRRRRGQHAILRALGFVSSQVRGSVMWQSAIATGLGALIGVPVGVMVGRATWLLAVREVGMVDNPATPWLAMAAVVIISLVGAALLAIGPGWYAARGRPAEILRTE